MVNMNIDVEAKIHNSTKKMKSRKRLVSEASHKSHLFPFSLLKSIPCPAEKIRDACRWIFDDEFHIK